MSEIVFILGAGASSEAGAPLMNGFLDRADELRKNGKVDDSKEDFDRVFDTRNKLQVIHSKTNIPLDNIEDVFAAFEMGRLLGKLPGVQGNNNIEQLLSSIKRVIFKTLEQTIAYPVIKRKIYPDRSYKSLAHLIRDLEGKKRKITSSVITFNYDIALDYAFCFIRHPTDYCISEAQNPECTPLLKLHGSLNWARCSKCGEIVPWRIGDFFKKFRFLNLEESQQVHLDIASRLTDAGLKHCEEDVEPDPVIVPPTWNKTEYHQIIQKVWQRAAVELSDAENILVFGYSLPESDLFFRYLFALGSVGRKMIKRFWVFDPDPENTVRPRFERLMGLATKGRFEFRKERFSRAVDRVRTELLS